jgi:ZIP family zinc transporter
MGFTAGVLMGVVFFDIFPEIISLIKEHDFNVTYVMISLMSGFIIFHIFEKSILIHHSHEEEYADHKHPHIGIASALALAGHSFMDGVGIGLGFQVSPAVGVLIAIAVIAHDFTDGMNTVGLMLTHKNEIGKTKWFLLLDSFTPVLGAISTLFFTLPENFLVLYLGFFAGFLLYIGSSDILPEAHSKNSSFKTITLTISGMILIFILTRFV